jgi:hypothetical protein
MSDAIAERASAIRHYLRDHANQALVRKYSFLAARHEQMRLALRDGKTTPADDVRFREVTAMLQVFTKKPRRRRQICPARAFAGRLTARQQQSAVCARSSVTT